MFVALVCLALLAAYIDIQTRTIPNWLCACVAICGVALQAARLCVILAPELYARFAQLPLMYHISLELPNPWVCLVCAAIVLIAGFLLEMLVRAVTGRIGMGLGDVKYLSAWATVLGWYVLPALMLACILGGSYVLAQRQRTFAFAPWLSLAFLAMLLFLLFLAPHDVALV